MELPMQKSECACQACQAACRHKPGWFAPGEVAGAARLLGLSLAEFFSRYVAVDFQLGSEGSAEVAVLAPANSHNPPGQEYGFDPFGQCVFYQEGCCLIHAAKPLECAVYHHDQPRSQCVAVKEELIRQWAQSDEPERLLGRRPVAPKPGPADLLTMLWGREDD